LRTDRYPERRGSLLLMAVDRTAYERDGYVVLRGLFPVDEVAAVAAETKALLARDELKAMTNLRVRWQYHYETGAPIFELFDPVTDIAPRCDRWMRDPRLLSVLQQLLGEAVHPIKDKLIYKSPGSGGYPLHQDYIAWPSFPESFTTVVVAIDGAGAGNGCIQLYPGAHTRGCLSERDGNFHILPDSTVAGVEPRALALEPGDVAIFGAFMPHRSDTNRSNVSRRHLLFSYNRASDGGDCRREHYQDFHHYLRSIYGAMGLGDMHFR
jgi:ectoine hydroxylase-related dioxygenase (phytanoyl-CoA dioxygenase family)